MPGIVDLTGERFGTLRALRMTARHPEPRYAVRCETCNTETSESHSRLRNGAARCRFSGCGQPDKRRDYLADERRAAAERENERLEEDRAASARRMDFETEGYERPTRYQPTPEPLEMTERQRLEIREFREAEEAAQRAADAPRMEAERLASEKRAEAEEKERTRKERERAYWAEWVQTDRDPNLFVTPELVNASMPKAKAEEFTTQQASVFASEPEYASYRTLENADVILAYLHRNGVHIADVETIRAAFRRLRDLGLLKQKTAPAPAPTVRSTPVITPEKQ